MHVSKAGILCAASGLVLLWAACGGEPPIPQVCPKGVRHHPDVPEEQRVTVSMACVQDSDCRSGLCDRGTCGDPYSKGNYGRECVPGPSPPPHKDDLEPVYLYVHISPFGRNLCTGFLCMDGRCRSCQSDAECQWEGSAGPQCLHYNEWPGKRCGSVADAPPRYPATPFLAPPPLLFPSSVPPAPTATSPPSKP
jgi:hypothetical protein